MLSIRRLIIRRFRIGRKNSLLNGDRYRGRSGDNNRASRGRDILSNNHRGRGRFRNSTGASIGYINRDHDFLAHGNGDFNRGDPLHHD